MIIRKIRTLSILTLLAAGVVVCAHWPVLNSQAVHIDDERYLFDNPVLQHPGWESARTVLSEVFESSTIEGYYEPLTLISLMLDVAAGGTHENLRPFHATSLVLHLLNVILVIALIYMLFGQPWIAAIVGLIFGVHPLTVEPVAWVWERKTVLSAFFALWCIILYVHYTRRPNAVTYIGAMLMFVLALMAKPTVTPLPALLLMMDFWPLNRLSRRAVWEKTPLFAVAALSSLITIVSTTRNATTALLGEYSLTELPLKISYLIAFYFAKIVWPANLSSIYVLPQPMALSHPQVLAAAISVGVLTLLLLLSLRRTRAAVTSVLFFIVAMSPTLGVVQYSWVAASDKYVYIPAIGLAIGLAALLRRLAGDLASTVRPLRPVLVGAGVAAIAVGCIAGTRTYLHQWENTRQLATHMLGLAPDSPYAHLAYANILNDAGEYEEALKHFDRTIELRPIEAEAYNNRGYTYYRLGDFPRAIQEYNNAIYYRPEYAIAFSNRGNAYNECKDFANALRDCDKAIELKPTLAEAYNNRGNVYRAIGDLARAVQDYTKAIELKSDLAEAFGNRGSTYRDQGHLEQALEDLTRAVELKPGLADAHCGLGIAYGSMGNIPRAIQAYDTAIELNPRLTEAYNNRGNAYAAASEIDRAIADYTKAIELKWNNENAYNNRGAAFSALGHFELAVADHTKAIEFKPNFAMAYNNRANAYLGLGDNEKAIEDYDKAIELAPTYIDAYFNRGTAHRNAGHHAEAVRDFSRIIQLNPEDAESLEGRAIAYFMLRQYQQAWADVEQCRSMGFDPNPELLQNLLFALGRQE